MKSGAQRLPHAGGGYFRKPSDRVMPRNQREAGIEFAAWEDRIPPLRSWSSIMARAALAAILIFTFMFLISQAVDAWRSQGWN